MKLRNAFIEAALVSCCIHYGRRRTCVTRSTSLSYSEGELMARGDGMASLLRHDNGLLASAAEAVCDEADRPLFGGHGSLAGLVAGLSAVGRHEEAEAASRVLCESYVVSESFAYSVVTLLGFDGVPEFRATVPHKEIIAGEGENENENENENKGDQ